jgi:protein phosphatase
LALAVQTLEKTAARPHLLQEVPSTASSSQPADPQRLLQRFQTRQANLAAYRQAYRRYCWPVDALTGLKLAPFHLLATEGKVHAGQDHLWHLETLARIGRAAAPLWSSTPYKTIDLTDPEREREGTAWWEELTGQGGEGMVVKPLPFVTRGPHGLVQPALKVRGREYLRIIYGPDYTMDDYLPRLRKRALGVKASLALREFALGLEALERFVRHEPSSQVHECVFAILALESEPVDPRL